jgi:transcriptional regulator with XRE-family HTH domain
MALFFDQAWFDAQLAARGLTRADVAKVLKLSAEQIAELWKDQREMRAGDVAALSQLLGAPVAEVAKRAGVSTPVPQPGGDVEQRLADMSERLARIERMIVELKTLILTPRG